MPRAAPPGVSSGRWFVRVGGLTDRGGQPQHMHGGGRGASGIAGLRDFLGCVVRVGGWSQAVVVLCEPANGQMMVPRRRGGSLGSSYPRTAASRGARRTGSRRGGSRVQSPACFVRAEKAPSAMSGGCGDSMGSMERRARGVWRHDETWSSFRSHRCQESCKSRPEP